MSRRADVTDEALQDVLGIAGYISARSLDAGDRFIETAMATFESLAEMPGMGPRIAEEDEPLGHIRKWIVPSFRNYLVFYQILEDAIEVVAVLHGARDIQRILRDRL